eukprot:3770650-Rhodomonas_salina.1
MVVRVVLTRSCVVLLQTTHKSSRVSMPRLCVSPSTQASCAICLPLRCAMSGADIALGAICLGSQYAMPAALSAYTRAMRCPVLTKRPVLLVYAHDVRCPVELFTSKSNHEATFPVSLAREMRMLACACCAIMRCPVSDSVALAPDICGSKLRAGRNSPLEKCRVSLGTLTLVAFYMIDRIRFRPDQVPFVFQVLHGGPKTTSSEVGSRLADSGVGCQVYGSSCWVAPRRSSLAFFPCSLVLPSDAFQLSATLCNSLSATR